MTTVTRFASILTALGLTLAFATPAGAQASRTWISGVGDDVNPCSRTAPCKTFAGAISKTAAGGEIDCLDPGGFGAVTITKAITLDCGGGIGGQVGAILAAGTVGVIINAGVNDRINIRNVSINGFNGSGTSGIRFIAGASLTVEHVGIYGFGASLGAGVDFKPGAAGSKLFMRDVEVINNSLIGINIASVSGVAASATLDNVFVSGSGTNGLQAADGAVVTISHSRFAGNGSKGVFARSVTLPVQVNLEGVVMANNGGQGVVAQGAGALVRLSDSSIYGNAIGIQTVSGGTVFSFGTNRNAGNGSDGAPTVTGGPQ